MNTMVKVIYFNVKTYDANPPSEYTCNVLQDSLFFSRLEVSFILKRKKST